MRVETPQLVKGVIAAGLTSRSGRTSSTGSPRRGRSLWQQLGEALLATGNSLAALEAFEKALSIGSPNRGIVSFALAGLYARGHDLDKAFGALHGMKPQLRFFAARLRTEPAFEALRQDARFEALMKDVPPPPK
jgi:tetratricopeptide (TPR) repeat protein